ITSGTLTRTIFGGLFYATVESLTLNAETGDNTINVNSTAAGTVTSVNANAGNDTVALGDGVSLNGGTVDGGAGTDTIDYSTFTATGLALPALNEAAFLGDDTYVNIHTTAFPGGEIRGQVVRQTQASLASGTATGTGGITGIENATGGSAGDSIVGSFGVNAL